jgi:hypothetical protein
VTESPELRDAIDAFRDYITAETLAVRIVFEPILGVSPTKVKVGEYEADVYVRVVS